jgi:hypothetical protein
VSHPGQTSTVLTPQCSWSAIVRPLAGATGEVIPGFEPRDLGCGPARSVSPDGRLMVVSDHGSSEVRVIDLAGWKQLGSVDAVPGP